MKGSATAQPLDLGAIVDGLPAMVAYVDSEFRYRYVNRAYEQRHGRSRDDIIGLHVRELLGEASYEAARPAMERALAGEAQRFEMTHTYPDGTRRILQVDYTPDLAEGAVRGFIAHIGDVTDTRLAQAEALLKSAALASALNGMAMADLEGRLVYVNPAFLRLWGYADAAQVLGRSAIEFWTEPADATRLIGELFRDGQWSGELDARRADNTPFRARIQAALIRDAAGKPTSLVGAFEDISEFHDAFEQAELFQRIAEATALGVGYTALDGTVQYFNPTLRRMLAVGEDEDVSRYVFDDFDTAEQRDILRREILPLVREKGFWSGEFDLQARDGRTRPALHNVMLLRCPDGTPRAYAHVIFDLSERRQREEQLRQERNFTSAVLENANALVVVLDREGRIRRFNRACENLSGYGAAEAEGRFVWDFLLPVEERDAVRDQAFRALSENPSQLLSNYTNRWVSRSGEQRLIEWHNTVLPDSQGAMEFVVAIGIDVTERSRSEQALRRSEETYARAEAIAHIGSWDWDIATGELHWTDEIYRIFGQPPQAFGATYQAFLETIHPDDRQKVVDAVNDCVADPAAGYDIEHRIVRPDGEVRVVQERGKIYRDEQGRPLRMIGTVHDVTERKATEGRLRETLQLLDSVVENIPSMIFMKRADDLTFELFNKAGETLLGYRREQLLGRSDFDFFPREQADFFTAKDRAVIEQGAAEIPEEPIDTHHQGRRILNTRKIVLRDGAGRPTHLLGISEDITERKRADDELAKYRAQLEELVAERTAEASREAQRSQLIVATAIDGFMCADADGHMTACNDAYCRMLGYESDELLRLQIADIEANESPAEVAAHIRRIRAQGHDRFDTRQRRKDGSLVDVDISVTLAQIDDTVMFFGFVRDITARKAAEVALIDARDTAERANRAKSDFLARMSHELRTPMNVILGFTQVLEHRLAHRDEARFVGEIHQAGAHLLELINELLDLARIEAGRLAVSISPAQLSLAIDQALHLVGPALEERKLRFDNHCRDGIHLLADPLRLKQVLINLLGNAVKFSPQGGRVTLDCQAIGGDRLRVTIGDAGPGIPVERQQELFKPFSRIDPGSTEGVGIGLALCKQLVELMAGDIGVDSAPGQGSRFWFELPLVAMPQPKAGAEHGAAREERQRVLYVEDNAANLRLVEAMFECWPNLALVAATDGQLGLDLARRQRPDAILLDIHLPGMDGFAVLAALKADAATRDIPVIALSADAMAADIERGLEAGFHAYLTKPVMIEDLLAALREALGARW